MKHIRLSLTLFLAFISLILSVSQLSAQKLNSLYFLDQTPIHTRLNPAMTPKSSGFGIGISNVSFYAQSDLAFDDLFFPNEDELNWFLDPDIDKTEFLNSLNEVTSFRTGFNMELITLGIRIKSLYFTFHSGINMDMGMGLPKDIFSFAMLGMEPDGTTVFDYTDLSIDAMLYNKTGLGFSAKIGNMVSIGANVDYLAGLANMRVGFDEFTISASDEKWDVVSKGYLQFAGPKELELAYSESGFLNGINQTFSSTYGSSMDFSQLPIAGNGLSFDLGVVVRPLSFLTLSAAVSDLGFIHWKKEYIQKAASDGVFTFDGIDDLSIGGSEDETESGEEESSTDQLMEEITDMTHFEKQTITEGYSTSLTTKINLAAEAGILKNHLTLGVLSQTGFASTGVYNDVMVSANLKPGSLIQTAFTYSLLHGEMSSFGAALNVKLLFLNLFLAADYIPLRYSPQLIPISNSYFNTQFGFNFMF